MTDLTDMSPADLACRVVVVRAQRLRNLHAFAAALDTPPTAERFATAERELRQAVDEFLQLCMP